MAALQWCSFVVIFVLVVIHGIWPASFEIDKYSTILLFILSIPLLAPFLKKARLLGAEFTFKENIKKATKSVEQAEAQAEEMRPPGAKVTEYETFSTDMARELIKVDPNLSLAALRIEMERVLHLAVCHFFPDDKVPRRGIRKDTDILLDHKIIKSEQGKAINEISNVCNEAVHGATISGEIATEIVELTERLNRSFAVGYSISCSPNTYFEEQGLLCEWEHCIERFPLRDEPAEISCQVFGHDCPGGIESRTRCGLDFQNTSKGRFVKD